MAPDVAIDLTGRGRAAWVGAVPPLGLWRLTAHGPGAGLGAAMRGAPWTEVALLRDDGDGPAEPLARARYNTKFIATRNAAFAAEKAVQLAARHLAATVEARRTADGAPAAAQPGAQGRGRAGAPPRPTAPSAPAAATPGPDGAPGALSVAAYAPRLARALARRVGTKVGRKFGLRPGEFALRLCPGDPLSFDPARGTTLLPPRGHFWADPFLFEQGGTTWLFYEDFDQALGRGRLAVGRLEGDRLVPLADPIEADHHLSYPFVFAADGEIWMIPETVAAGRLEVWRAVDFPRRWTRVATAFEGRPPADAVLARVRGNWWLFANLCDDGFGDYGSELHLFRVDGPLLRRIEPHPLNPVVIDAATARGGGRVWEAGGRLFRASQDNTHDLYGWGLNLMEITRLDMAGYTERRVRHIRPGFRPGVIGCHHMDWVPGRVVIDLRYRFPGLARG